MRNVRVVGVVAAAGPRPSWSSTLLGMLLLLGSSFVRGTRDVVLDVSVRDYEQVLRRPIVRIHGGSQIPVERYPYAEVSLQKDGRHQCGGTLIAADMIMSAAHCLDFFQTVRVYRYNSGPLTSSQYDRTHEEVIQHWNFDADTFHADVMVIRLTEPIAGAQPVRLNNDRTLPAVNNADDADNEDLRVVGWGKTSEDVYPNVLHHANVPLVPNAECANLEINGMTLYQGAIFNSMLCAGGSGVDACRGDSGSPLIIPGDDADGDIQVGIVSWGRGCAVYPGVYTRVHRFYPWIRAQVCWYSQDPPSYMMCRQFERNPLYLVDPTPAPVGPRPTLFPTVEPTVEPSPWPTEAIVPTLILNALVVEEGDNMGDDPIKVATLGDGMATNDDDGDDDSGDAKDGVDGIETEPTSARMDLDFINELLDTTSAATTTRTTTNHLSFQFGLLLGIWVCIIVVGF